MSGPNLYGTDLWGDAIQPAPRGKLADTFLVPPFSVLNAREGWWQERKRAWIAMGIQSELGRGTNALSREAECEDYKSRSGSYTARTEGSGGPGTLDEQRKAWADEEAARRSGLLAEAEQAASPGLNHYRDAKRTHTASLKGDVTFGLTTDPYRVSRQAEEPSAAESGTSIFDPVLCELAYRWWCEPGGMIVDPFAGGSVRGIVACLLDRHYWGCDLRAEQVAANETQAVTLTPTNPPQWLTGDARDVLPSAPAADFLFSCPPYGDLERYSDDPRDLSAMDWPDFRTAYLAVINKAVARLKPDRFAAFVVGDFRDKKGHYRGFVGLTTEAFRAAGCELYNEAVLITVVGSLPVRVGKQWEAGRKLGKTHQNVLVFVKGDWRKAVKAMYAEPA